MKPISIIILGASGYTGAELIRLLNTHPYAQIKALCANTQAGQTADTIFPHLQGLNLPTMQSLENVDFSNADLVFCCLPHAKSQAIIHSLPRHLKIIDLSADFRLRNLADYQHWYGTAHQAQSLQLEAVYGLSEHYRTQIATARLIANPGCYPTCSLLPIIPLLKENLIAPDTIIIDAKSGVSGAGRTVQQHLLYNEVAEGMTAYGVNNHRHIGEITQEINAFGESPASITFVPHLVPMRRGMCTTMFITLKNGVSLNEVRNNLNYIYKDEPFIHILPEGNIPSTHHVRGSNNCHIGLFAGSRSDQIIIISVIDNLMKGASGQAIQNMNIMYGLDETTGLKQLAVFP